MARREQYTALVKKNQIREQHVKGMGDTLFKGFNCLNSSCKHFVFVKKSEITAEFEVQCEVCGYIHKSGEEANFYNYKLITTKEISVIEEGVFGILHDDYIREALEYKYCIVCNLMKPANLFSHHGSRASGRQGECRLCKIVYNTIKNQTRISDQHREAAQKRRMYLDLS